MTPELIYWITRLDGVRIIIEISTVLGLILTLVWIGGKISTYYTNWCDEDDRVSMAKIVKSTTIIPILFILLAIINPFIPSTKDMAIIYVLPKIANSELAQELPEDLKTIKDMAMSKVKDMLE